MIFTAILLICLLLYTILKIRILAALFINSPAENAMSASRNEELPGVSVVIPFRNEADNLETLLGSLGRQKYKGFIEIVLVNDSSTDNSVGVIHNAAHKCPIPVKLVESIYNQEIALTSKQQALDLGVRSSRYGCIVFTDADMQFDEHWVYSLVKVYLTGALMVFGHTSLCGQRKDMFALWQSFQLEYLFTIAYAFNKAGITGSSMGNNMLIDRKAYESIGGQEGIGFTIVEDRELYNVFTKRGYSIRPVEPFLPAAFTYPCTTLVQFYHQMRRWARGGFTLSSNLLAVAVIFALQNFIFTASILGLTPLPVTIMSGLNFLISWIFLTAGFKRTGSKAPAFFFPLFYLILIAETVVIGLSFIIRPSIIWKARKIR